MNPLSIIVPVLVGQPGHEPAGVRAGEPLRIDAGRRCRLPSEIVCEPLGAGLELGLRPGR